MHVAATQVKRPGNVIERSHKHSVSMPLVQSLSYAAELRGSWLACIFQRMDFHRVLRHRRTVGPYVLEGVQIGAEGDTALLPQVGNELSHLVDGAHHSIDAHFRRVIIPDFVANPLGDGGCSFHLEFHQLVPCTAQLLLGSEEVARVGPQGCAVQSDDRRTCRTVETAYPLAALPVVGHIFTLMRVGAGEDESRKSLATHHLAQLFQPFVDSICHDIFFFMFLVLFHLHQQSCETFEITRISIDFEDAAVAVDETIMWPG